MKYPTDQEIEEADMRQLGEWQRFLESPVFHDESMKMDRIMERFMGGGGWTPRLSKLVGWEKPDLLDDHYFNEE